MSEETTRNFFEVMRSFRWPDPEPIFYRLYHDQEGKPVLYSMENLPGAYIEVDQETYARASHDVRVRDGRLVVIESKRQASKLSIDPDHGTTCDPRDVCVVVDAAQAHKKWKRQTNEID